MRPSAIPALLLAAAWLAAPASAEVKIAPEQRYLLLATTKTSTMEKELTAAAALGFRVIVGSPTSGAEMAVLLERVATPPETYTYKLLATTATRTMQKELDEAAKAGYRLLPRTMIAKKRALIDDFEVVVLLERPPKPEREHRYRLLATTLTSTLQKEIAESLADGYTIAGMVSRDEHMVIMEKESALTP